MTRTDLKHTLFSLALMMAVAPVWPQEAKEPRAAAHPLVLDAQAIEEAGIAVADATARNLADEIKAPGEVKADAYSTVLVAPRVESTVVKRVARLGDIVEAGQPLVVLSSIPVAETQGALIVAEQEWRRVASLGLQAVSGRRYTEVKVQRDQARAKLRAYGLSAGQIGSVLRKGSAKADGSYALLAPTAGRVTTDRFLVGERVDAGRTLFTLVKEDAVWVEAQLPPADAARIQPHGDARIVVHDVTLPGKVAQRSHQADGKTRTASVRIEVDNRKDLLHQGELVETRLSVGAGKPVLAVPAEAVVLLQNQATVFVSKGAGRFEPVPVVAGESRGGWVEIKLGLKAGTPYVSKGAFALKARLLRSQLGEG